MIVSGIRPSAGFYEYNSIKIDQLRQQQEAQFQGAMQEENTSSNDLDLAAKQQEARKQQTYTSFDFANEYEAGKSYELKGADSELENLDVEKALTSMKKDQVLQQYQFFVGNNGTNQQEQQNSQAAVLRSGENFIL